MLLLAVASALLPAGARASAFQESIVQDDNLLLASGDAVRDSTLDEMRAIGADTVRAFVPWAGVAPAPASVARPAFDPADPAAYDPAVWDRFDELVRATARRGMGLILTPTSPVPAWASQCPGSLVTRRTCNPNPIEFGRFMVALGLRYSGTYRDENGTRDLLPRVRRWAIWNEPNLASWLSPQFARRGRLVLPVSADRYRRLVVAATGALRITGHGADQVLMGETAPIGRTTLPFFRRPVATAEFLRAVLCIDRLGRGVVGLTALHLGCRVPRRLAVNAIAHHPYVQGGSRAPFTPARFDEITISSAVRLKTIMAQAVRRGRIGPGLPVYYTEFGFQTNPPDRILGVPLAVQASYLNQSEWIAFRDPAVRGVSQYLLRDDGGLGGFQTGLRFSDGRAKPSLAAYRFPIWVVRRGISVTVFGQVREAADGATGVVRVQVRLPGRQFATYRTLTPNRKGFVTVTMWSRRGRWRLIWEPAGGTPLISRETQEAFR